MVFVYYSEANPRFGPLTLELFRILQKDSCHAFTSALSLGEVLSFPKVWEDKTILEKYRYLFGKVSFIKSLPVSLEIASGAGFLRVKYNLSLPDAIHLATALWCKAEVFITNDQEFKKAKKEIPVILLSDYV